MKRSRDVGRGVSSLAGHHRAHSPHQSRDAAAAAGRREADWSSRDNPASRDMPAAVPMRDMHSERDGRRQRDRRDAAPPPTSAAPTTNNIRPRNETTSEDSSAGVWPTCSLHVCVCSCVPLACLAILFLF